MENIFFMKKIKSFRKWKILIISSSNSDISIFNEKDESNHYINKKFEDNLGIKDKKYSETKKIFLIKYI